LGYGTFGWPEKKPWCYVRTASGSVRTPAADLPDARGSAIIPRFQRQGVTVNASTLPADAAAGRVALRAFDLDRLVDFYGSVVGLDVQRHDGGRATLGAGGTALLELHAAPDAPARGESAAGLFHTAFRVPTRAALGDALDRVESNWRLTGASDHHVSEALYLRDPEDNGVEVYCDRPRGEWPTRDGRVAMDTLPLDFDPLREAATGDGRVPDGTDVGHIHLEVTDLSATRAFYVDALGLDVRQARDGALFVAAGGYHHHVGLNTWNGRSAPAAGRGLDWFELRVRKRAIPAVRKRLADSGADVCGTAEGLAFADPDGVGLRVRPV
jgi:catechol 2,3-dioxygenase